MFKEEKLSTGGSRVPGYLSTLSGYDIFVSYRTSDGKAYAEEVYNHFRRKGKYKVFLDQEHLYAGDNLPKSLQRTLKRTTLLVMIISPQAAESVWMKEELQLFTRSRTAKVFPVFFKDHTSPGQLAGGFEALKNFVGFTEASLDALAAGRVAPQALTAIENSLGFLTKKRVFRLALFAAAWLGGLVAYFLYQGSQRKESEYWSQMGVRYLEQSQPDLAEMALAKAGNLQPARRSELLPLYWRARGLQSAVTYGKLPLPAGYRLIGGTTMGEQPALVLYSDEAKKLLVHDGKRPLPLPGSWPEAPEVHAFPGKLALSTGSSFFSVHLTEPVQMTEHVLPERINELRVAGTKTGWQVLYTTQDTLTVVTFGAKEQKQRFTLAKPIAASGFLAGGSGGFYAVTRAGGRDRYTTLMRWLPGIAAPKADSFPMPNDGTFDLLGAAPSAAGNTFVLAYGYAASMLNPLEDYKVLYLPDDPFRKTIPLEVPSTHVQPLDDGVNYVAYLSQASDLKVLPQYDYVVTSGTPRTVVTSTRLLKTWGAANDYRASMLITADDSTVRIVRGTQVIYKYTFPSPDVQTIAVLPFGSYFCVAFNSYLYLWKQSARDENPQAVPDYDLLREQLQIELNKGEPPIYLRFL